MRFSDTIAAVATPAGAGGIGIVRISGPAALDVFLPLFEFSSPNARMLPRRMVLGRIRDPGSGRALDEVLAVFMPGPRSYTGEDVVEIQAHGGLGVTAAILEAVLSGGARLADPGEFTRRAFLNGRLDLAQAEAVWDMVEARSAREARLAAAQLSGALGRALAPIRASLESLRARLSAAVDFPDEVEAIEPMDIRQGIEHGVLAPLLALARRAAEGELLRRGLSVALLGKPNVGKSSLLNALLGRDRAIVSPYPGTTRDSLSETLTLDGHLVSVWDTAGLRIQSDPLEALGMEKTREAMERADVWIVVVEAHLPLAAEDIALLSEARSRRALVAANKSDLLPVDASFSLPAEWEMLPLVSVSALRGDGLENLSRSVWKLAGLSADPDPEDGVPNLRHRLALEDAARIIRAGLDRADESFLPELLALDLEEALARLGDITGESVAPDVLDAVFSRFCVGK